MPLFSRVHRQASRRVPNFASVILSALVPLLGCDAPEVRAPAFVEVLGDIDQVVVITAPAAWTARTESADLALTRVGETLIVNARGSGGEIAIEIEGAGEVLLPVVIRETDRAANPLARLRLPAGWRIKTATSPAGTPLVAILGPATSTPRVVAPSTRRRALTDAVYPMVFPFFALELLGETLSTDTADVEPNLDAVNALAYERHHIEDGAFIVRGPITSDPKAFADENNLPTWPMITHDRPIVVADIQSLFDNRAIIIGDAVAKAVERGYTGYILDVEVSYVDIATPRSQYLTFVSELTAALHAEDVKLMVATARWINLAPIADLAATDVDYIASMDPMHPGGLNMWLQKMPPTYNDVDDKSRLVWVFSWDFFRDEAGRVEQLEQMQWMEDNGYNDGVAGASCFRSPMATPNAFHLIDYYEAFRNHYPAADPGEVLEPAGTVRGIVWDRSLADAAGDAVAAGALLPSGLVECGTCGVSVVVDTVTASWSVNLPPGTYAFSASAPGFSTVSNAVTVSANATAWSSLGLFPRVEFDAGPAPEVDSGTVGPTPEAPSPEGPSPEVDAGDAAPLPRSVQPGCGCDASGASSADVLAGFALVFLAGVRVRRRRRGSS